MPRDILAEVLGLPAKERARIAHELILSLEEEPPEDQAAVEGAWAAEIERRMRQIDEGTAKLHDWDTVRRDILSQLRRDKRRRSTSRSRRSG